MITNRRVRVAANRVGVCLSPALLVPAHARASLTAFNTNSLIYQPGNLFVLKLLLGKQFQDRGDIYVKKHDPMRSPSSWITEPQFTSAVHAFRPDFKTVEPSATEIFSSTPFPFEFPGTYTLQTFQARTGTDPANLDNLIGTGFPVRIAFIARTAGVGTNTTILTISPAVFVNVNPATKTPLKRVYGLKTFESYRTIIYLVAGKLERPTRP